MKSAFIIIDGLGNIPGKSPLDEIELKNINELVKNGRAGIYYSVGKGIVPGSDIAHLYIFGYNFEHYCGRGPLEALGLGIKLQKGDIAFRTNFALIEDDVVLDRRAGRIKNEYAKELEKKINEKLSIKGYEVIFKASNEHRGVLVIRGRGLSKDITDTDPGKDGLKMQKCLPKNEGAKKTAEIVNRISKQIKEILKGEKANALLLRGAGEHKDVESFEEKHGLKAEMIAGGSLYKGVARYVSIEAKDIKGATGDINSNYKEKLKAAINAKEKNDVVFIHLKAPDNYGHDGNKEGKIKALEKIDKEIIKGIMDNFEVIVLTGDHATPWQLKRHSSHPVPLIAYGETVGKDDVKHFSELHMLKGSLGILERDELIKFVKDWINKSKKLGS
jgi:2,3-bisphosphoglycerate-independent phosphoglycerate mutase